MHLAEESESLEGAEPEHQPTRYKRPPVAPSAAALRRERLSSSDRGERSPTLATEDFEDLPDIEEFFDCVIEEIGASQIRLHTRSLSGEEAVAWLPLAKIPESEHPHIVLGAPVRITVFQQNFGGTRRGVEQIRILRRDQWQVPVSPEARDKIVETLLQAMNSVVTHARSARDTAGE